MWKAQNDYLWMPLLLSKKHKLEQKLAIKKYQMKHTHGIKKKIGQVYAEIVRRLSLSLSIITFTFLGAAYGCSIGRFRSKWRYITVCILAALYLSCYLAAKGIHDKAILPICLYTIPHLIMIICSIQRLKKIERGICA